MRAFWTAFGLGMASIAVALGFAMLTGPGLGFVALAVCAGAALVLQPVTVPGVTGLAMGIAGALVLLVFGAIVLVSNGIG